MKNKFFVCGDEVFIKLSIGEWTVIDIDDFGLINNFNVSWHTKRTEIGKCYAVCQVRSRGKLLFWSMHRVILRLDNNSPLQPDHINGDSLDNRKKNLRAVTSSINNLNRRKPKTSSGIAGVIYKSKIRKWFAYIEINGRLINLGYYKDKEKAIDARLKAEDGYV